MMMIKCKHDIIKKVGVKIIIIEKGEEGTMKRSWFGSFGGEYFRQHAQKKECECVRVCERVSVCVCEFN